MTTDTLVLAPMAPTTPLTRSRSWFRQLGVDTGYVLVACPVAVIAFVVLVTGLTLGTGLLIVWVGVAVLAAALLAAAHSPRPSARGCPPPVPRRPLPRPAYRATRSSGSRWRSSPSSSP